MADAQTTQDPNFKSLHQFLLNAATKIHSLERPYLFQKINGEWKSLTYNQILTQVDALCAWFVENGLQKGDRVALILENSPEYYAIDQALQKLGLVNVSIYPTLTPEETQFILTNSGAKALFVGNQFLLKKFKKVEAACPEVKFCISLPEDIQANEKFLIFDSVLMAGTGLYMKHAIEIKKRFEEVGPQDLATLIYTSGTTGVPKGAMLTHYNFMSNCYDAKDLCPAINKDDLFLSFLPLSHVYERMATYYLTSFIGAQVAFSEGIEKVASNIQEIKPTIMACVPRLLERVHDKVIKSASDKGGLSKKIFFWALNIGTQARLKKEAGKSKGLLLGIQYAIANKLVFGKVKEKMGGRMRLFVSGGGALPKHVGEFFANLGLQVQEGYGLTETSPFISVNEFHRQVYGTVGRIAPRQQVAIQNHETGEIYTIQTYNSFHPQFESAEGEILAKGPNIMKGYYNNPEETAKVFDADGWFHTGDIGKFEHGNLKITDRLKNMLVTSLGKNIYPTQVENNYLRSPKIDQIFIIGDKQEYVSALVVLNPEEANPAFALKPDFWNSKEVFIDDESIRNWVWEDIKKLSENLAKFERIKEFKIKRHPFTVESEEMTISLKVKRKLVMERYKEAIESMYK